MGTDLLCAYLDRIQAEVEGLHSELARPGPLTPGLRVEMADHMIALTAELAKVRAHGVAIEREESVPGFGCVAAPIGRPGEAVAAGSAPH